MLGLWCVIRPVTAPLVITLPCTRPSGCVCSIQLSICAIRFCNIKYSAMAFASGKSRPSSVVSSTMTLPFSVNFSGFQPFSMSLSAICLRLPGLKSSTMSERGLPVVLWVRPEVILGGKILCISTMIDSSLVLNSANNCIADCSLNLKPLRSWIAMIAWTSCSSSCDCVENSCRFNSASR